jgi:hypothetical protein
MRNFRLLLVLPVFLLSSSLAFGQKACSELAQLALPDGKITLATTVAAGLFTPPGPAVAGREAAIFKHAPAFCRVAATLAPSSDSEIKVEVWMPENGWNGRLKGQGNGGFAGYINYVDLAAAMSEGSASVSTDTGHSSTNHTWALGHPEKITDYGYRGIHEMTVSAKVIVQAFYGRPQQKAYFAGCSNGGRQALMEAQRYPDDYDAILAGAPANDWTTLLSSGLNITQSVGEDGFVPPAKVATLAKAVVAACDARDGVADGVLNDPRACHFDPATLLCKGADADSCLTARQVETVKAIYAGERDTSGQTIFPGFLPGAEMGDNGWVSWITGKELRKGEGFGFVQGYFSNMVYDDPKWDFRTVKVDDARRLAEEKTASKLNATDADLKPFVAHGGKLILFHGWNDPAIPSLNTVHYYEQVASALGPEQTASSVRLYMIPGMQHCAGGPGADIFGQSDSVPVKDAEHNIYTTLIEWREKGSAPGTVIATKYEDGPAKGVKMTRPICPYPQEPVYSGTGDTNSAASFVCRGQRQ